MKRCLILCFMIGLSVNFIACGGDEIPEDSLREQTPLETLNTTIDVEEMVLIPAGEVSLGTDNKTDLTFGTEADTRTVFVAAFYMDKYEVTNKQYAKILSRRPDIGNRSSGRIRGSTRQINRLSVSIGKTLELTPHGLINDYPQQANGEKAARGTDGRLYPWGE